MGMKLAVWVEGKNRLSFISKISAFNCAWYRVALMRRFLCLINTSNWASSSNRSGKTLQTRKQVLGSYEQKTKRDIVSIWMNCRRDHRKNKCTRCLRTPWSAAIFHHIYEGVCQSIFALVKDKYVNTGYFWWLLQVYIFDLSARPKCSQVGKVDLRKCIAHETLARKFDVSTSKFRW